MTNWVNPGQAREKGQVNFSEKKTKKTKKPGQPKMLSSPPLEIKRLLPYRKMPIYLQLCILTCLFLTPA